jgi:hypothetical protein
MEEQARIQQSIDEEHRGHSDPKADGSTTEEEKSDNPAEFKASPNKEQNLPRMPISDTLFSSVVQLPRSESADSQLQEMSRSPPNQTGVWGTNSNSPKQTSPQQQKTEESVKQHKMRALFNFTARNEREISFKKVR